MKCRTDRISIERLARQKLAMRKLDLQKLGSPIKFTNRQQQRIKEKYESRCALCCLGVEDGVDICVTHKRASIDGGNSTLENGLVLCTEHNKTRYDADANHAKIFVTLMLKIAKHKKDKRMENLYFEVLSLYEKYSIF